MELDNKTMKKLLLLAAGIALIFAAVLNPQRVFAGISYLLALASPFILGACIAFIINVPMSLLEKHVLGRIKRKGGFIVKGRRPMSLVLTIFLILGALFLVIFLIVPEMGRSISLIASEIPSFVARVQEQVTDFLAKNPSLMDTVSRLDIDWRKLSESAFIFFKDGASTMLSGTINAASGVASGLFNFFLAFIFAIYILLQKEKLGAQFKRLFYAYFPKNRVDYCLDVARLSKETFSKFLTGQCAEALILSAMFFITMTIFRMPHVLTISVLIAVTALVPILGSFIGCIIGAFLILIVSPIQALWFVVLFLVLQQLEGNLIYPYVVGNSIGLPSIWVLVAVTIGGSLMGIAGMLIFIPAASVAYSLLRKNVRKKLKEKNVSVSPKM